MRLKDKKTNFLIEIRKQQFNNYFANARRKLDSSSETAYDPEGFDKALTMLYRKNLDAELFHYKLKDIRRMSCSKGFYIKDEMLSDDLGFFLEEIVQTYYKNDEIMEELTHFLINCFYEENFRIRFSKNLIETFNFLAEHRNKEVINNLLNILLNMTSDGAGAEVVIDRFRFDNVSGYLTGKLDNSGVEIEYMPLIGLNVLKKAKDVEYHKVSSSDAGCDVRHHALPLRALPRDGLQDLYRERAGLYA